MLHIVVCKDVGVEFFILTMLPLSGGIGAYASLIWWYRRPTLALILGTTNILRVGEHPHLSQLYLKMWQIADRRSHF